MDGGSETRSGGRLIWWTKKEKNKKTEKFNVYDLPATQQRWNCISLFVSEAYFNAVEFGCEKKNRIERTRENEAKVFQSENKLSLLDYHFLQFIFPHRKACKSRSSFDWLYDDFQFIAFCQQFLIPEPVV